MIVIIDYEVGNLGSIKNIIKKVGHEAIITNHKDTILNASKIILPGVGSFDKGMDKLDKFDLINILTQKKEANTPVLGICLGMQLLTNKSEEGSLPGLGFVDAEVKKFSVSDNLRVPHMGWNDVAFKQNHLTKNLDNSRYYFVHSYYVDCKNEDDVLGTTTYGNKFVSAFIKNNVIGVQFHPEKSHKFGMTLMKNFCEYV